MRVEQKFSLFFQRRTAWADVTNTSHQAPSEDVSEALPQRRLTSYVKSFSPRLPRDSAAAASHQFGLPIDLPRESARRRTECQ